MGFGRAPNDEEDVDGLKWLGRLQREEREVRQVGDTVLRPGLGQV